MCLKTEDPTIKVAQEDIIVYKSLDYRERIVPETGFLRFFRKRKTIKVGYSAHRGNVRYDKGVAQPTVNLEPEKLYGGIFAVEAGYHSHADYKKATCNAEFIIPKGTKYIEGWNNDMRSLPNYVSETIVFRRKI